jgi:ribonuclease Z
MEIIFMGTASAAGSIERDNTYLLLRSGEAGWLIDVGGNPLGKLKHSRTPLDHIQGVILTHMHTDHIYGLTSLLWGMWVGGRRAALTIHCSSAGEEQLRAILKAYQVESWPIGFELRIETFDWEKENVLLHESGLELSTFPSLHAIPTVGIKAVTAEGKVMIYSADTRPNERIVQEPRIDLLIHEATKARGVMTSHTSLEDVIRYCPVERIGQVYCVHLTDDEPYLEVLEQYRNQVQGAEKVRLAEDMLLISL